MEGKWGWGSLKNASHMLCPNEGWGVCMCVCARARVLKECRPTSETKEAAAAFNVPAVCPSLEPQAEPQFPPLAFMVHTVTGYRRGKPVVGPSDA